MESSRTSSCILQHALHMPLVMLMLIKSLDSRQMEASLAQNVVARLFIGRHTHPAAQIRHPSNIARADSSLGKAGIEEVNQLMIKEAHGLGFVDAGSLSADTTVCNFPTEVAVIWTLYLA